MKILVTGGCGFIGSHIVDYLVATNHQVIVIDNESAEDKDRVYKNPNAIYYQYCITDYANTVSIYAGVDAVFHLAAIARIQRSFIDPINTIKVNTLGTVTVLECCAVNNVKRVIFSSTSSIYGNNRLPFDERMPPDCLTPYAVSKLACENLCQLYNKVHDIDTVILRYFNVYGDRQPIHGSYATVIGLFLKQYWRGVPLSVIGDGSQRRDFTHIEDVINANMLALHYTNRHNGEVYNIGTGKSYSILEVAQLISDKIEFVPKRNGELNATLADITKAKVIGYYPSVKLEDWLYSN
jgi:nucleoside-diphosphate-sugar epimerase